MKKCNLFLIIFVINVCVQAQVTTTIFPAGNAFETFPFFNQVDIEKIPIYEMPPYYGDYK